MKTKLFLSGVASYLILNLSAFTQTSHTWTGSTDSNWGNTANWNTNLVPATGDHVIISNGIFDPFLNDDREIGSLTIQSGAVLNLESYRFTIKGNWNNQGKLIAGNSTVAFLGTAAQSIAGNQTFYNLEAANSAGITIISGSDSIVNVMTISSGNFSTNDALVFISNAGGTASLAELGGSISGKVKVQRYLDLAIEDWRFISSPVSNFNYTQISDDFMTMGFPGSTYPSESFVSVYSYNESDPGTADYGYVEPVSITTSLPAGTGFMAWMGGSNFISTLDFYGYLNTGSVDIPVTYTPTDIISDGWNLAGNPYASAINWDDASITRTNMDNAVYIWNPTLGVYSSYVDGIGANGGSNLIASGQSFYVRSNAANPELIVTETSKKTGVDPFLKTVEQASYLSMKVENSAGVDETAIKPKTGATNGFDSNYDADKMFSSNWNIPSVYSTDVNDRYYSINQFEPGQTEIPIYVNTGISEMHEITFDGIESFDNLTCVLLEDLHTGIIYDLRITNSISVFISDTTWWPRFILKTGAEMGIQANDASCYGTNDGTIQVAMASSELFSLNVYNQFNGLVSAETGIYEITEVTDLAAGMYVTELTNQTCGVRIDTVFIAEPLWIEADFFASADTIYIPAETGEISFDNTSVNAAYYTWEFGDAETSTLISPTHTYTAEGSYSVHLTAYQNATCYNDFELTVKVISSLSIGGLEAQATEISLINNVVNITTANNGLVEVFSMTGQRLFAQQMSVDDMRFELPETASQYVIVAITSGNERYSEKIFNPSFSPSNR